MKKFVFNMSVISSLLGGINLAKSSPHIPKDWRFVLTWIAWAISLVFTIDSIAQAHKQKELEQAEKEAAKLLKTSSKRSRKSRKSRKSSR